MHHSHSAGIKEELSQQKSGVDLTLYYAYNNAFEVVKANTPALRNEVYKLRYQIYCLENPFENPSEHLDGLEMDAYDAHAEHHLLIYRPSGLPVGSVRIVLPDSENLQQCFPMQSVCDIGALKDPNHIRKTAEISRFCMSSTMRKRLEDDTIHSGFFTPDIRGEGCDQSFKRRLIYHASLGLMRNCIEWMMANDTRCYFVCEPTLLRILGKLGIECTPVGPFVEYHGRRQPATVDGNAILRNTIQNHPEVWAILSDNGRLKPSGSAPMKLL